MRKLQLRFPENDHFFNFQTLYSPKFISNISET